MRNRDMSRMIYLGGDPRFGVDDPFGRRKLKRYFTSWRREQFQLALGSEAVEPLNQVTTIENVILNAAREHLPAPHYVNPTYQRRVNRAAWVFYLRRVHYATPAGRAVKKSGWQPDGMEVRDCCRAARRRGSRQVPPWVNPVFNMIHAQAHYRTAEHCGQLFGVQRADVLRRARQLEKCFGLQTFSRLRYQKRREEHKLKLRQRIQELRLTTTQRLPGTALLVYMAPRAEVSGELAKATAENEKRANEQH